MSSLFDPSVMLNVDVDAAMDTKVALAPEGRYKWQITNVELKKFEAKEPGKKDSFRLELTCEADANQLAPTGEKVADLIGRDKFIARYSGWADLTEDMKWELGTGKNVALGAIREATGLNTPGQPFRLGMLKGQVFSGDLKYRVDKEDSEKKYGEIRNPSSPQ